MINLKEDNSLTGRIPSEIASLTELETLPLSKSITICNQNLINIYICIYVIVFVELNIIIRLPFLLILFQGHNKLTGSIPSEIGSLTELTSIALCKSIIV